MKKILFGCLWFLGIAVLLVVLWKAFPDQQAQRQSSEPAPSQTQIPMKTDKNFHVQEPIQPIPLGVPQDPSKIELGRQLFNDTKLSKDNSISCASCHFLNKGGADFRKFSMGVDGNIGNVNAPSVYNSGYNFKQFWDGRSDTLEEQVNGPTHNPAEMASNWDEIVSKLKEDPAYSSEFPKVYSDGITNVNVRDAIATFERSLITPNSRFDKFLRGDANALSDQEKRGYKLFKQYGCTVCHQGINVGGNMFQTFGKFGNYFEDRGNITKADLGRMNVTGDAKDKYKFKVPALRNTELTAPYFHDGSAVTLEDAVRVMAKYQLGVSPSDEDVKAIVEFLKSLTGEYKGQSLKDIQ